MKFRCLAAAALAGTFGVACRSTSTTPTVTVAVSVQGASATAVTGGINYQLTIHLVNSGIAAATINGVGITLATSSATLGTNTPGLPFASSNVPAHAALDSRLINITDSHAGDPIATLIQVTVEFIDSSGQTTDISGNAPITLTNGTAPPTPAVPATSFDTGRYKVGIDIAPGRYFAAPSIGCYLERESALDGTTGEILGDDFVTFAAPQWIVEIASTDVGFYTSGCGAWAQTPLVGVSTNIGPGMFIVNTQIAPGTYQVAASAGCYWERLSDFSRSSGAVLQNAMFSAAATTTVTIAATDAGFDTSPQCGTWTPAPGTGSSAAARDAGSSAGALTNLSPAATRQAYRDWLKATGRIKSAGR